VTEMGGRKNTFFRVGERFSVSRITNFIDLLCYTKT